MKPFHTAFAGAALFAIATLSPAAANAPVSWSDLVDPAEIVRLTPGASADLDHAEGGSARASRGASAPAQVSDAIHVLVTRIAAREGVPSHIAHAVVRNESNYRPGATGRAGEIGLMQIKIASARGIGFAGSRAQLYDPVVNLTYGMRYLRAAAAPFGYSCAGLGRYQRGRFASPACSSYGRRVMALARL